MGIDSATWQALGLVLTLVGLGVSGLVWWRRGAVAGLRAVAWSLLPLAAGLTGTLRLVWRIGSAIASWATHLVFSPVVWLGLVVAGTSAVLFAVTGLLRRRAGSGGSAHRNRQVVATPRPAASADRTSSTSSGGGREGGTSDPELEDVEAILRRHGIS